MRRNPYVTCGSCGAGNKDTRGTCFKCQFDLKPTSEPFFGSRSTAWSRPGHISRRNPCGCDAGLQRNPGGCGCSIDWRQDNWAKNPAESGNLYSLASLARILHKELTNSEDAWTSRQLQRIKDTLREMVHYVRGSEKQPDGRVSFTNRANAALIAAYSEELGTLDAEMEFEEDIKKMLRRLEEISNPALAARKNSKKKQNYRRNG